MNKVLALNPDGSPAIFKPNEEKRIYSAPGYMTGDLSFDEAKELLVSNPELRPTLQAVFENLVPLFPSQFPDESDKDYDIRIGGPTMRETRF